MPTRPRPRYRVLLWLDESLQPTQAAVARYWDDVKETESTWTPGPFDTVAEVLAATLETLPEHLSLL